MSERKENCPCPNLKCPRKGYCRECIEKHNSVDGVPYCIFPAPKKDLRIFYEHLKERFEPNS